MPIAYVTNYHYDGSKCADGHSYGGTAIAGSRKLPFGTKVQFYYNGKTWVGVVHDRLAPRFDRRFDLPSRSFHGFVRGTESAYMRYRILYRPSARKKPRHHHSRLGKPH